jgi:hypothetical protein
MLTFRLPMPALPSLCIDDLELSQFCKLDKNLHYMLTQRNRGYEDSAVKDA